MKLRIEKNVILNEYSFLLPFYLILTMCAVSEQLAEEELWFIYERVSMRDIWWNLHRRTLWLFFMANSVGVEFTLDYSSIVELKKKVENVINAFIESTKLIYLGKVKHYAANFRGLLHPYDYFMAQLMNTYAVGWVNTCSSTYIRTNPLLPLRLDQAEKFSQDIKLDEHIIAALERRSDEIFADIIGLEDFDDLAEGIRFSIGGDFDSLNIDSSAAAGFPYKSGVKRGKVKMKAIEDARQMLADYDAFDAYMNEHVWYTTGRAKLQTPGDTLSARIICYPGFSNMLMNMLFYQPFHQILERFEWCAVGMSWMNDGARKFANSFGDLRGVAPDGYEYCSLDVSGWDASMCSDLLNIIRSFYLRVLSAMEVPKTYQIRFVRCFDDMVKAKLTFPGGFCFQTRAGMKSGWPDTSHCDTLGHDLVFSLVRQQLGIISYKLYGDDNFFLKPVGVSNAEVVQIYSECGFRVKVINSSKYLKDVDFLSKHIHYVGGDYLIYRESVETFSRLLMPEEGNPGDRELPSEVIAAERLVGHLLDNPFNSEVREAIYAMLGHLRDHYQIYSVEFSDRFRKQYMFKPVNFDRITSVPIIPSINFIKDLYGVGDIPLVTSWPRFNLIPDVFEFGKGHRNMNHFQDACAYYRKVRNNVYSLGTSNRVRCVASTSPYVSPRVVYGYHAARLAFAVEHFKLKFKTVVDFGSHPGACSEYLIRKADKVTGVSLIPDVDKNRRHPKICPYVLRNRKFTFVEADVNHYRIDSKVDLLHDDVDAVFVARDEKFDVTQALESLRRFSKHVGMVKQAVMTVHDVNHEVVEAMYSTYRMYGGFDMVRPFYSNPWKPEFILLFYKNKVPRMKRSDFVRSCYKYFNEQASSMVGWCSALNHNAERVKDGEDCEICQYQDDEAFQQKASSFIIGDR